MHTPRIFALQLLLGLGAYLASPTDAHAGPTKVGDTKDACDGDDIVKFKAKDGTIKVAAGQSKTVDMAAPVSELTWYCGDDKERVANDVPWDRVKLTRASNGALSWTFYRLPPPSGDSGGGGSSHAAGDTADGCDGDDVVRFKAKSGDVFVSAGQNKTVDLSNPVTEMKWWCGNDEERVANDEPFDRVQITRKSNGAVKWKFFLKTAAPDPKPCNEVHATGRLVYRNSEGSLVPLARAQVKLMDEDFGPADEKMAVGMTDADGRFDLRGTASEGPCTAGSCKKPDPYVDFVLVEAHRIDVRDPLGNTARSQTATREETCGDVDFGTQQFGGAELNPRLFARGQRAYSRFSERTGDARVPAHEGLVEIESPTVLIADTPYTTYTTIHWPWYGDRKDDLTAIDHEFGHRIRHTADGSVDHFNWDATRFVYARSHSPTDVTNEGFAFNEGWAEYFEWALGQDKPTTWTNNVTLDPEEGQDIVEGDVDQHLRALHTACGGLDATWAALALAPDESIHSIDEYRAAFVKRFPSCKFDGTGTASSALSRKPKLKKIPAGARAPAIGGKTRPSLPASIVSGEAPTRARITAAPGSSAATKSAIQGLAARQLVRDKALHDEVDAAYKAALASLQLPIESLHDGTYDAALKQAKADLAAAVGKAQKRHREGSEKDIGETRKSATSDDLRRALDDVRSDLQISAKRLGKTTTMPRSFWPKTKPVK